MAIRTTQTFNIPAGSVRFFKTFAPLRTKIMRMTEANEMTTEKTVTANSDGSHSLKIVNVWPNQAALDEFDAFVASISDQIDAYNGEQGITKSERTTETV